MLYDKQVPSLELAEGVAPGSASIFAGLVLIGGMIVTRYLRRPEAASGEARQSA